jgi:hypothetical protein
MQCRDFIPAAAKIFARDQRAAPAEAQKSGRDMRPNRLVNASSKPD